MKARLLHYEVVELLGYTVRTRSGLDATKGLSHLYLVESILYPYGVSADE